MTLLVRHAVPTGVVALLLASLLAGCGTSQAQQVAAPTPSFSQAPVETYTDTESADDVSSSKPGSAAEKKMLKRVHLAGVSIGADGHYIVVRFKAPPRLAESWRSAPMSVTDERTGAVYDQIPTMPLVGLLFAPPHTDGQVGYVTFVNEPRLPTDARLTVALGDFEQKHVAVEGGGEE
jgi:hypothetical protein